MNDAAIYLFPTQFSPLLLILPGDGLRLTLSMFQNPSALFYYIARLFGLFIALSLSPFFFFLKREKRVEKGEKSNLHSTRAPSSLLG